jgi:hypothetical protein
MEGAKQISQDAFEQENRIRRGLCELWKRMQAADKAAGEEAMRINQIVSEYQCIQ